MFGYYVDFNIVVFGCEYYLYVIFDGYEGWGGKDFYVWKFKDLVGWICVEELFLILDGDNGNVFWVVGNVWVFIIIEKDDKYYFYFSGYNVVYDYKIIGVVVVDYFEGFFIVELEVMIINIEVVNFG